MFCHPGPWRVILMCKVLIFIFTVFNSIPPSACIQGRARWRGAGRYLTIPNHHRQCQRESQCVKVKPSCGRTSMCMMFRDFTKQQLMQLLLRNRSSLKYIKQPRLGSFDQCGGVYIHIHETTTQYFLDFKTVQAARKDHFRRLWIYQLLSCLRNESCCL